MTLDVVEMVAELTTWHQHREHYQVKIGHTHWGRDHVTRVPSLLCQLETNVPSSTGEDTSSSGFRSQPAAHLESLDTLVLIDKEAARWVRDLGEDDPGTTAACVSRLHGLMASMERCKRIVPKRDGRRVVCCAWHEAETDVRRWWTQARVVTGWDSPAWRPDNTCPNCEARGGLRIRLADQSAMCIECRETWDRSTIGLLAEHIRGENHEEAGAAS